MDVAESGTQPPQGTQTTSRSSSERSRSALASDFDAFLRLLTAQLRNQDPLQPVEGTEFVAQLASFSTVEQLIASNEHLDAIATAAGDRDIATMTGWIGLETAAADGSFRADGSPVDVTLPATTVSAEAVVEIVDAAGSVRARLPVPSDGGQSIIWDGRDAEGGIPMGEAMRARVVVANEVAEPIAVPAIVWRTVVAVELGVDGPVLRLADGASLDPDLAAGARAPLTTKEV